MESGSLPLQASPRWPYLAAAAVLPNFEPHNLAGIGPTEPQAGEVYEMLLESAEPVRAGPAKGAWKLREDVRRRVLAELSTPESIGKAVEANAERSSDPTTRVLQEVIAATTPLDLAGRPLEELLAFDLVADWLGPSRLRSLPSHEDIRARIQREKLLEPMRRLVVGFQGREDDLRALRGYVDALPSESKRELLVRSLKRLASMFRNHRPFVIHGPGGAGKSTLIAKFILDHAESKDTRGPMPFILLDFDRSTLDPGRPDGLLIEVASQLKVQFPAHSVQLDRVADLFEEREQFEDVVQFERSAHYDKSEEARAELAEAMNDIANDAGQNLLFVLDTFEIVQRRGATAVYSILDFIGQLLSEVKRLRVVIVGRADLQQSQFLSGDAIEWQSWPLKGFDRLAGRSYLRTRLEKYPRLSSVTDADLDRMVLQVRGNPLALRLVAQVFAREGASGVEAAIGPASLDEAIAEGQLQGMLHARIIEHLDNEELKKIASPGLVVRRITPEVIRKVLAGPCEINLDEVSPEVLFHDLQQEFSLVEPVEPFEPDTVRHRPDVRELMLSSLRRKLGKLAGTIDDAAVAYWQDFSGPVERAEELYHRLWRSDPESILEERWIPDAEEYLRDAWDEFEVVTIADWPRIWLSEKLNRELPDEVRARADQLVWERDAARKARSLLSDGKPDEALRIVNERSHDARLPASPLWLLEIDALFLRGDLTRARSVIEEAYRFIPPDNQAFALHVMARRVSALERQGDFEAAGLAADEALQMARTTGSSRSIFSCGVTRCRLADLGVRSDDAAISSLRAELVELSADPGVQQLLADSPTLLREAVAVLGASAPLLIADALERFGPGQDVPAGLLAKIGVKKKGSSAEEKATGGNRSWALVARSVRGGEVTSALLNAIAELFSETSERLAKQVLRPRARKAKATKKQHKKKKK
jgi:tetratricopeptide (TPR) repeat protein